MRPPVCRSTNFDTLERHGRASNEVLRRVLAWAITRRARHGQRLVALCRTHLACVRGKEVVGPLNARASPDPSLGSGRGAAARPCRAVHVEEVQRCRFNAAGSTLQGADLGGDYFCRHANRIFDVPQPR
eukprot:316897-Prymnesium_polylepis.1